MTNIKTNLVFWILIFLMILTYQFPVFSQTQKPFSYSADLIIKKGADVERKDVFISQENGTLKINGAKDRRIAKQFSYASIKNADYSYSEKPQIKEAIIAGVLTDGFFGVPFLFNKTKKHWLVLKTESDVVFLELQKDSYRRLLLEMNSNGIKVEDLGDRDSKEEPMQHPKPDVDFIEGETCGDEF